MCIYIFKCMYICMYIYNYICLYIYIYTCMCVCVDIVLYTHGYYGVCQIMSDVCHLCHILRAFSQWFVSYVFLQGDFPRIPQILPGLGSFWVLDPIDGTKGFLRKEQYAICLCMVKDGTIMASALGCPNLPVRWSWRGWESMVMTCHD